MHLCMLPTRVVAAIRAKATLENVTHYLIWLCRPSGLVIIRLGSCVPTADLELVANGAATNDGKETGCTDSTNNVEEVVV
mmetsp:Transcript_59442/g.105732  ORF Transcript_59442/g.105732 Transcript_59442/m.105732 type:complete len:80 (-) Transcript_59442:929-1168(-)